MLKIITIKSRLAIVLALVAFSLAVTGVIGVTKSALVQEGFDKYKYSCELKELGVIERVIPETFRGEPLTQAAIVKRLKADLIYKLKELSSKELPELLEARYQRFRKY